MHEKIFLRHIHNTFSSCFPHNKSVREIVLKDSGPKSLKKDSKPKRIINHGLLVFSFAPYLSNSYAKQIWRFILLNCKIETSERCKLPCNFLFQLVFFDLNGDDAQELSPEVLNMIWLERHGIISSISFQNSQGFKP